MILLYSTLTGDTRRLAKRFKMTSKEIKNFSGDEKIVILSRRMLKIEDMGYLNNFINRNKKNIIGVIIYDDKMFGEEFGKALKFYVGKDIKILAIWDKIISNKEIYQMEESLNEYSK